MFMCALYAYVFEDLELGCYANPTVAIYLNNGVCFNCNTRRTSDIQHTQTHTHNFQCGYSVRLLSRRSLWCSSLVVHMEAGFAEK